MLLLDQKKDWKKKLTSASCRAHARSPGSAAVSPALRCRFSSASPSSSLSRPRASLTMLERERHNLASPRGCSIHTQPLSHNFTPARARRRKLAEADPLCEWVSCAGARAAWLLLLSLSFALHIHPSLLSRYISSTFSPTPARARAPLCLLYSERTRASSTLFFGSHCIYTSREPCNLVISVDEF